MKIFIGSSTKALNTANYMAAILETLGHDPYKWNVTGTFIPSVSTIENLEKFAEEFDAAIFIYAEDDLSQSNDKINYLVRDNVLLEAGIFSGKMGHERVGIYIVGNPHIPSDQSGLTLLKETEHDELKKELSRWLNNVDSIILEKNTHNVCMSSRDEMDYNPPLEERWRYAKEITIVNYACTAFLASDTIVSHRFANKSWRDIYHEKIKEGCKFKFILTEPNTYADFDASYSKMKTICNANVSISNLILESFETLKKDIEETKLIYPNSIDFRTSTVALPYGAIMVINDDEHMYLNHIKVDLYSPYLNDDHDRRSFILYEKINKSNFDFFSKNITQFWNQSDVNPKVILTPQKIENKEIENFLTVPGFRQYFVGDLKRTQPIRHIYDKKIEVGRSFYGEFTADIPHCHTYATEFLYIIKGEYKIGFLKNNHIKTEHLQAGDFFAIPKQTYYASKACADTEVLFIKAPGLNDKQEYRDVDFDTWLKKW